MEGLDVKINDENCKLIPGFSNYACSDSGKVFSIKRKEGKIVAKELKLTKAGKGHLTVCIKNDSGKFQTISVHKLILITFVGECPEGMECIHKDENRCNNDLSNIEWGLPNSNTARQNTNLVPDDVLEKIKMLLDGGHNANSIARILDLSYSTVYSILKKFSDKEPEPEVKGAVEEVDVNELIEPDWDAENEYTPEERETDVPQRDNRPNPLKRPRQKWDTPGNPYAHNNWLNENPQ